VQLPVSATATSGAQNTTAGTASGLFGRLADVAAAKKGQLPPFASILVDHSKGVGDGNDSGEVKQTANHTEILPEASLSEAIYTGPEAQSAFGLRPAKDANESRDEVRSGNPASAKDQSRTVRHRTAASPGNTVGKKPAATASDPPVVLPVVAPSLTIPTQIQPVTAIEKTARTFSGDLATLTLPALHQPAAALRSQQAPVADHQEADTAEQMFSTAIDTGGHHVQPHLIAPLAKQQDTSSSVSGASDIVSAALRGDLHRQNVSEAAPLTGTPDREALPLARAESQLQSASVPALGPDTSVLKPKGQQKIQSEAIRSLTVASSPPEREPYPATAQANGVGQGPAGPLRAENSLDSGTRQGAAVASEATPFQHLDAGAPPVALLHGTPHQIAVGVHDPSLGWLEVQTQSSAGHISATLTAASVEAHASLAAQAPAITQYLADREVSVHSLHVHTQAGTQNGASGGEQSQSGSGNAGRDVPENSGRAVEESRQPSWSETETESILQRGSAAYISVRA
jgi:hypothetical protein